MTRTILLANNSPDSDKATKLLDDNEVPYELLKADAFWTEIDWPVPTLFYAGEAWKGLKEIEEVVAIIAIPDGPN